MDRGRRQRDHAANSGVVTAARKAGKACHRAGRRPDPLGGPVVAFVAEQMFRRAHAEPRKWHLVPRGHGGPDARVSIAMPWPPLPTLRLLASDAVIPGAERSAAARNPYSAVRLHGFRARLAALRQPGMMGWTAPDGIISATLVM